MKFRGILRFPRSLVISRKSSSKFSYEFLNKMLYQGASSLIFKDFLFSIRFFVNFDRLLWISIDFLSFLLIFIYVY